MTRRGLRPRPRALRVWFPLSHKHLARAFAALPMEDWVSPFVGLGHHADFADSCVLHGVHDIDQPLRRKIAVRADYGGGFRMRLMQTGELRAQTFHIDGL